MADVIWTPVPAAPADDGADYRLLVCAASSEVLYVLIEGPVSALVGTGLPDGPVPLWHLRVITASGDLSFLRMSFASDGLSPSFFVARLGPPGSSVDALTVTLVRDDESVMTAHAVRLGVTSARGVPDVIWTPGRRRPAAVFQDFRLVVCVEGSDALHVLMEGPIPGPNTAPPDPGRYRVRAGSASGDLAVKGRGGVSFSRKSRAIASAGFERPDATVGALDLALERDDELLLEVRAVRWRSVV